MADNVPKVPKEHDKEVRVNVKNFHIARASVSEDGTLVYETPEHLVGVESVGRKVNVAEGKLYGDGVARKKHSKKTDYELSVTHNGIAAEVRSYMEGTTLTESGLEYGSSDDVPGIFATGWEVEKTGGYSDFIWWPYCQASPIEESTAQTEDNVNYSNDSIAVSAMQHPSLNRFFTRCDTEIPKNREVTAEQWFSKVQIEDSVQIDVEPPKP